MHITYLGHSCFKIQDKTGSEAVTIITDPFNKEVGLPVPHCEADIVTVSHNHSDHNNIGAVRGKPSVLDTAGEYDIKGVSIIGTDSYHDEKQGQNKGKNIIFRIIMDEISIVHLGDLGHILDAKQLEKLQGTDILLVPVGGKYTLDAERAAEVVSQIEPRIVIPMHYKSGSSRMDVDGVEKFIKEIGLPARNEEKLKINKKDLPQEDMELVILGIG
jgi:L-ascorbate metabolism protein UlaG (beta-lactamase superfamily)